jgi:hypothetical protein
MFAARPRNQMKIPGINCLTVVMLALTAAAGTAPTQQQERPWKFEDDFSSRAGGWPTGSTNRGDQFGYADGKYRIVIKVEPKQVGSGQIAGIPLTRNGNPFQTLEVEADAIQRTGPPTTLHGVSCGTSPTELYFFLINLEGQFFIVRDDAKTASADMLLMGRASVPFRGIGETNRIRVQCGGGQPEALLALYVNGAKVGQAKGRGTAFDRVAFVVTTLNSIAGSTHMAIPGVDAKRPGSPTAFEAEILFGNFVARGLPLAAVSARPQASSYLRKIWITFLNPLNPNARVVKLLFILIVMVVSSWITALRMRRRMRKALGRKVREDELVSINDWIKVAEAETRAKERKPLG